MAQANTHLLVFGDRVIGDRVIGKRPMIRILVRNSKSSAWRFLQQASDVVQIELAQLTPDEHGRPSSFESLLGLAEEHASRRLGDLIVSGSTVLRSKDRLVHVLALYAGQVPAAAAVAGQGTSEVFAIARQSISEPVAGCT